MSYFGSLDELYDLRDEVKELQGEVKEMRDKLNRVRGVVEVYHVNTPTGQEVLSILDGHTEERT